jgi:hypothetical protein
MEVNLLELAIIFYLIVCINYSFIRIKLSERYWRTIEILGFCLFDLIWFPISGIISIFYDGR